MKSNYDYIEGLPEKPKTGCFEISDEGDELVLKEYGVRLIIMRVLHTYRIPLKNIIEFEMLTHESVTEKSVIGRGALWEMVAGGKGMMLGATGDMQPTTENYRFLGISYTSNDEPDIEKVFLFDMDVGVSELTKLNIEEYEKTKKALEVFRYGEEKPFI